MVWGFWCLKKEETLLGLREEPDWNLFKSLSNARSPCGPSCSLQQSHAACQGSCSVQEGYANPLPNQPFKHPASGRFWVGGWWHCKYTHWDFRSA